MYRWKASPTSAKHHFGFSDRVKSSVIMRMSHVWKNTFNISCSFIDRFPFLTTTTCSLSAELVSSFPPTFQNISCIKNKYSILSADLNHGLFSFFPCRESVHHLMAQGMTPTQFLSRCSFFSLMWMLTNYLLVYTIRTLDVTVVMSLFACTVTLVYLLSWVVLHHQFVGIRVSTL